MYQIAGLVFEGFQLSGISGPFDVFNVINTLWKQQGNDQQLYQCQLVARQPGKVTASNGTTVVVEQSLSDTRHDNAFDVIVVPGIHHISTNDLTHKLLALDAETQWLAQHHRHHVTISANCSGVFLLAEAGILGTGPTTTAWWLNSLFERRYPEINLDAHTQITQQQNVFSTGAMTANISAMLQIAETQIGRQLVIDCARTMLIDANQDHASPYLFMQSQSVHQDTVVLAVESWMQRHISQPLNLKALAALHHVSERTLSRRFQAAHHLSPREYQQQLRIRHTRILLETTDLSMDQLAERIGYNNASSLRRLFQKSVGMSPRDYRTQQRRLAY